MDIDDFERWWRVRERADIVRMIAGLEVTAGSEREIGHLRASAEMGALLRRSGRRRLGCRAAHRVRLAVVDACRRTGVLAEDRAGVTRLARAAGEAAQVLVCGAHRPVADELLAPFRAEVPLDPAC